MKITISIKTEIIEPYYICQTTTAWNSQISKVVADTSQTEFILGMLKIGWTPPPPLAKKALSFWIRIRLCWRLLRGGHYGIA